MCVLTDFPNENEFTNYDELMNDPNYIAYMEQKHKEMNEYMEWYLKSIQDKVDMEIDPYEFSHIN